jgi:hypothetical protein
MLQNEIVAEKLKESIVLVMENKILQWYGYTSKTG